MQEEDHVIDAHVITDKVCTQQPSVRIGDVEGLETLAKLVSYSNGSQRAGQVHSTTVSAVIVAYDSIGHLESYIVWVSPARSLYCNGHVGQRQGIITMADLKQYM